MIPKHLVRTVISLCLTLLLGALTLHASDGTWAWQKVDDRRARVFTLSPAFAQDNTIFAGVGIGEQMGQGILKSMDGGNTWEQMPSLKKGTYVRCLQASPAFANDQTLFAVVSRRTYRPEEGPKGVIKTTDGGLSWINAQAGIDLTVATLDILSLAISPEYERDQTVLLGMQTLGLFRTTDGGASWQNTWRGEDVASVSAIAFSPDFAQDRTVFLGTLGMGILRSTDGGETWEESNEGVSNLYLYTSLVSPNYAQDGTIFFGAGSGIILRSTDGGSTWKQTSEGIDTGVPIWSLAFSPGYPEDKTLYAGDESGHVFRSTDNGETWQDLAMPSRRSIDALAVIPSQADHLVLAAPTGQGIWRYSFVASGSSEAATATAVAEAEATREVENRKEVVLVAPTPLRKGPRNACIAPIVILPLLAMGIVSPTVARKLRSYRDQEE